MRRVRLLKIGDVGFAEFYSKCFDDVIHALRLRAADDRCRDVLGPMPGEGDPCHRHAEPFREPVHAFDDRHILRTCLIVLCCAWCRRWCRVWNRNPRTDGSDGRTPWGVWGERHVVLTAVRWRRHRWSTDGIAGRSCPNSYRQGRPWKLGCRTIPVGRSSCQSY